MVEDRHAVMLDLTYPSPQVGCQARPRLIPGKGISPDSAIRSIGIRSWAWGLEATRIGSSWNRAEPGAPGGRRQESTRPERISA